MMIRVCLLAFICQLGVAEAAQPIKLTVGGTAFPNTAGEQQWRNFERNVRQQAGEQFDLRMLIYGQLGSEEQLVSGLRRGRVNYANLSAMVASTVVPELSLLYMPYLFASREEADFVYDHFLTERFSELLEAGGLHFVAWNEIGFHHIYSQEPLLSPQDAKGVRFRVSAAPSARMFAQAIGADVIPLGFGEIVASLQTGLIEAGENSVTLYARTGTADEAPHLTLTGHAFGMSVIVAGDRWWQKLNAAQQQLLTESFPTIQVTREAIRGETDGDLAKAQDLGFTVHDLTPTERDRWRAVVGDAHQKLVAEVGGRSQEVYDLILEGKAVYASQLDKPAAQ
jgi:TRAP-type C4-dicarboxylate transport system substrate-binding protein